MLAEDLFDKIKLEEEDQQRVLSKDLTRSKLLVSVLEDNSKLTLINQVVKPFQRAGTKIRDSLAAGLPQFVPTGFEGLDRALGGGIRTNTITQIVGGPQSGKTTLVQLTIRNFLGSTTPQQKKVLYISPAWDEALMKKRVAVCLSR